MTNEIRESIAESVISANPWTLTITARERTCSYTVECVKEAIAEVAAEIWWDNDRSDDYELYCEDEDAIVSMVFDILI